MPVPIADNRLLQCAKVKPVTLKVYHRGVCDFSEWAKNNCKSLTSHLRTDEAMSQYIHHLCWEGRSITEASNVVFGWILLRSPASWHMPDKEKLPISRQALKGWRSRYPGRARTGVDLILWDLVALGAARQGNFLTACAILIQGDTYMRPSEVLNVTMRHLLRPLRSKKVWGIMIGLSEEGTPAKNGEFDECVFLDTPSRLHVNDIITGLVRRAKINGNAIFDQLTLEQYEKQVQAAATSVALGHLKLVPHMLRHSGASHDAFHELRSFKEIQVRGRWKAVKSLNRYKKPGLMLLTQSSVTRATWKNADKARPELLRLLQQFFVSN